MKRFIALLAFVSFAIGLNATITKEDIYNSNLAQIKQMKKELNKLNEEQTKELKQAFINKQINQAFKAVFLNKNVLKNANSALVKNGEIIQTSKAPEAGGVYFWHEFSENLQNPPAPYTCVINNGTWEDAYVNSTCGVIKYRMDSTSPLAAHIDGLFAPALYLMPDIEFTDVEDIVPGDMMYEADHNALVDLVINRSSDSNSHPPRETQFESFQTVTDTPVAIGYMNTVYPDLMVKPLDPKHHFDDMNKLTQYYTLTENTHPAGIRQLYTLNSGTYMHLMMLMYDAGQHWWDGQYVFFKWFKLTVVNNYLDNVGIKENANDKANIIWNNSQVIIDLKDSVNPSQTTYGLYDISGKLLQSKKLNSNHNVLDIPSVSSGVYIVKVKGQDFNLSKKIVIKK